MNIEYPIVNPPDNTPLALQAALATEAAFLASTERTRQIEESQGNRTAR